MSWNVIHTSDKEWLDKVYGRAGPPDDLMKEYWTIEHIDPSCYKTLHIIREQYLPGVYAITDDRQRCWNCGTRIPERYLFILALLTLNI